MAHTTVNRKQNLPGFEVVEMTITCDDASEGSAVGLAHGGPEYATPFLASCYTKTPMPADDEVAPHVQIAFDEPNAEVDLTVSSGTSLAGLVLILVLLFPTGSDQDGTSIFGSGNTGITF